MPLRLFLAMVILFFTSCAGAYQQAAHTANQSYLGMSIAEFKSSSGRKAKLEAMEAGYTVYRMHDYEPWFGTMTDTKFFYFNSSGRLYRIDGGEFKQSRYQLEIINR